MQKQTLTLSSNLSLLCFCFSFSINRFIGNSVSRSTQFPNGVVLRYTKMLQHAKSDSDITSLDPSSPRSPKRPYYVQSPSRDSNDEDKSSSMQHTPSYNTPTDSPSHPSYGHHSRASSSSRFSGTFRSSRGRKRNDKGWPECNVIEEEGDYDDFYSDRGYDRRCQIIIAFLGFVFVFSIFCLIIWGASRSFKAQITVKSLTVHNFYFGEGADMTGVPTKMLTMNCSMKMNVYNPATFFGIHVSSAPVNLMFYEIAVATGEVKKYYQPRKSHKLVTVNLKGNKIPLYGAGVGLAVSDSSGGVPVALVFEVRQRGNVVGKLVKTRHLRRISCSLVIDSHNNKPIKLEETWCKYN